MFKNWAKVRIRDDGVESEGPVHVYDERTSIKGEYRYGDTVFLSQEQFMNVFEC